MTCARQPMPPPAHAKRFGWSLLLAFVCTLMAAPAQAAPKTKGKVDPKATRAATSENATSKKPSEEDAPAAERNDDARVDGKKAKVLTFGALDVEGKMRTPQLLFFLNRVKAELDSTTALRRSFMNELHATAKEKGL